MADILSIKLSKELRNNYSQISELCRQNPVAITVNGREDIVILSHEYYVRQQKYIEELETRLAVYLHLAQAEDDVKIGRTESADDVFDDILGSLDGMEL